MPIIKLGGFTIQMTSRSRFFSTVRFIAVTASLLAATSCKFAASEFGVDYSSLGDPTAIARALIASDNCVINLNSQSATVAAGKITTLVNLRTSFPDITAPLNLTPSDANLGELASGWIKLDPSSINQEFTTDLGKMISSDAFTIVALIKNTSRGDIISINPVDRNNEAFEINFSATEVKAFFRSSPSDNYSIATPLPASSDVLVGASFANTANDLSLSVNGNLLTTTTAVGSPSSPSIMTRLFALGSAAASEQTEFKELYIFRRKLSNSELGSVLSLIIRNNSLTGITLDSRLASSSSTTVDPNFTAARTVLRNYCTSCHGAWYSASATTLINAGLVVRGDPENSKLYYRVQGSSGASGPKNMPDSGGIPAADVEKIKTWISGL